MSFTRIDLLNLQAVLKRGTYNGLEEAQVAVLLDQKIQIALIEEAHPPKAESDGNVSTNSQ